jgi:hypothetical protein
MNSVTENSDLDAQDPTQLDQRTEAFFLMFERELQRMSDEEFQVTYAIL